MGKKRIVSEGELNVEKGNATQSSSRKSSKRLDRGTLYIKATYNNTLLTLTDMEGNAVIWSSSGSLGFRGAKKGTPFAAGKVAELIADKAQVAGLKEIEVVMNGVGSGREAAIRAFIAKGIGIDSIRDVTPVPFNGPKPKKPRRV